MFYFGVIYLGEELIAYMLVLFFSCRTIMKQVATAFYNATPGMWMFESLYILTNFYYRFTFILEISQLDVNC